ncbi:hypothetical protein GYMLUDRAFT_602443 [Collybiopsis luxurians FD-317 M1]|uniref:Uncharacterized protein n=1 Tax=Collybiopsis luxurians FD-317 M1 TaxID=944289 RepID=A0A0D0B9H7_9AGAR|nr:hypothetical protein GYMLUDRAFT_602443 [Collybiopsis luxurians FD-317 M1]
MDRPSTSKARGICRYYQYPRGCFAGDGCKFLHGDPKVDKGTNARLTPYDQAKTCRYFAKGFCKHGDKCWFRHITPKPVDTAAEIDPADEACSICFENPPVYGLLAGCSHVFCISCLKEWRDPKAKSADVVQSGVHKKCPMCRAPSKFIIPSSLFYKQGDPQKEQTITAYKDSMAKVPCRYFVQSRARNKDQPFCPFGKDCFYRHSNEDGSMYVFTDGVDVSMRRASEFRERRQMDATDSLFSDLFAGVNDGSIRNPFDVFSRFLQDSQLADAFSDLFQGLVRDPPADTRDRNPRSPPARPAVSTIFDTEIMPDRPIDSWSLDGHLDTTSGVRVTIHGLT